jgi:hypothetical protein
MGLWTFYRNIISRLGINSGAAISLVRIVGLERYILNMKHRLIEEQ